MTVESRHASLLKAKILERRDELKERLTKCLEHVYYMQLCGEIMGLDNALALSAEADNELYGGRDE